MPISKRLTVPWSIEKKKFKFVTTPRGAHPKKESIPLSMVIKDMLKLADTTKEAKKIIKQRKVLVDKGVCTDHKRGIGLFDLIEIPSEGKAYRLIKRKKYILINAPEPDMKLCKIKDKKVLKKGKIQLNLHDGRNILLDKNKYSTNDSILIKLPEQKIVQDIKFEPGALALVISGAHSGELVKIVQIEKGLNKRLTVKPKDSNETFEVGFDHVIIVGKDTPLITLGEQ